MTDNPTAKTAIEFGKAGTSLITGGKNFINLGETLKSPVATGGMLLDAASVSNTTVETVNKLTDDELEKLRRNGN